MWYRPCGQLFICMGIVVMVCFALTQRACAEGLVISVPQLPEVVAADTSVNILVQVTSPVPPAQAYLNYRIRGQGVYEQAPMVGTGFQTFFATIPRQYVTVSGVEFFISASDESGTHVTMPSIAPEQNPFVLLVQTDTYTPSLISIAPPDGVTIPDSPPEVAVEVSDASYVASGIDLLGVRMLVDGNRVVVLPQVLEYDGVRNALRARFAWQPETPLTPGVHAVEFEVRDRSNNIQRRAWSFTVAPDTETPARLTPRTVPLTVHGSVSYTGTSTEGTGAVMQQQRGMSSTGNWTVDYSSRLSNDLTIDGTISSSLNTIQALEDPARKDYPLIVDRYALRFRTPSSVLTIGDNYTEFPSIVMGTPNVKGITYEHRPAGRGIRYTLFLEPERTPSFSFIGIAPASMLVRQARMGARAEYPLWDNHSIALNYLSIKDELLDPLPGSNSLGQPTTLNSQIVAISGRWLLMKGRGTLSYAIARSDEHYRVGSEAEQSALNRAATARLDLSLTGRLSLYTDYFYMQPNFGQLSVFGQDQNRLDAGVSYRIGDFVTARVGYATSQDNLLGQKTRATITRTPSWSINANFPKWPSVSINGRRGRTFTDDDPVFSNLETQDLGYTIFYFGRWYDFSVISSQSSARTRIGSGSNSDNNFIARSLTIRPLNRLSLTTRLTTSEFKNADTLETSTNNEPAYEIAYEIIPNTVKASVQFASARSYNTSNTADSTRDTSTFAVTWNPRFRGGSFTYSSLTLSYQNIVNVSPIAHSQDYSQPVIRFGYQLNY